MLKKKGMSHEQRRERRKDVANFIAAGHSLPDAAVFFRITITQVRGCCQEHGVAIPDLRRVTLFEVLKMLRDKVPTGTICKKLGITRQRVSQVRQDAKKAGVL